MKAKRKIFTVILFSGIVAILTAFINKIIFALATSKDLFSKNKAYYYNWRFGNIYYKKEGKGKPILLVHDLTPEGSHYEWHKLKTLLKESYTVYTIDLLGCGCSEKPNITYTNYLYVQMLTDFVQNVIGHRTDIICSGSSSSLAVMACNNNPDIFNQILLINPDNLLKCNQTPNKKSKLHKLILETPVIGTLIYNIAYSKENLLKNFCENYLLGPFIITNNDIRHYHEAAHLSGSNSKAIYASIKGNYINISVSKALEKINNSIIIIGGEKEPDICKTIQEYKEMNPAIESIILKNCKHLPQLELPNNLYETIRVFLR